jgi:hypothetical protein
MLIVRSAVYGRDMTDSEYPWEPPMAGTEAEHLTAATPTSAGWYVS